MQHSHTLPSTLSMLHPRYIIKSNGYYSKEKYIFSLSSGFHHVNLQFEVFIYSELLQGNFVYGYVIVDYSCKLNLMLII